MKIPNYVLCSHYPLEHSASPCASVYQLFVSENRIADLYSYIYVLGKNEYIYKKLNELKGDFAFLFNGYNSLLSENSLIILRYAFMNNIDVTIYWHETAWNLRDLTNKSNIDFDILRNILISVNLTNFVPTSQCMHAIVTAFGFPFESFKIVFEVFNSNRFIAVSNKYDYKNKNLCFAGAGIPNYRKGIDIYSYIAHHMKKFYSSSFLWFTATPGNLESKRIPYYQDVDFMGHYKNFYEQLKKIDIFLLTSRDDPSPLVALEALACNKPTFAFSSSGYAEVLPHEFIAYSVDDMIDKIQYFIEKGEYSPFYFSDIAKEYTAPIFCKKAYNKNNIFDVNIPDSNYAFLQKDIDEETYQSRINMLMNKERVIKRKQLSVQAMNEESYNILKLKQYKEIIKNSRIRIRKLLYDKNLNSKQKICVVGNSPYVLKKEIGNFIDTCDVVIRINNFVTKGYEKYVGKKTTYAVISPACRFSEELFKLSSKNIYVYGAQYIKYEDIQKRVMKDNGCKIKLHKRNILNHELYFDNLIVMLDLLTKQWPSTGMAAIQWAVDFFRQPVFIYGFDLNIEPDGTILHYFNHVTHEDGHHNFFAEKKRLNFMLKNKEIMAL